MFVKQYTTKCMLVTTVQKSPKSNLIFFSESLSGDLDLNLSMSIKNIDPFACW